ncbi:MAG: NnrU family protein [Betaproteobacteria bacterium]
MTLLVVGLAVFLGIHLVPLFPSLRRALAARLGEGGYKGAFSLISAVGLVLIVMGFGRAPATERVFAPFPVAIAIAPLAMTLAFILFAAANMRGHLRKALKHPMLLGLLIWSSVHLLANGDLRGTVLFGGFLAYAVMDLVCASSRNATKTFMPEVKFDVMAIVGGIAVALGVMTFHRMLFGVGVVNFGA